MWAELAALLIIGALFRAMGWLRLRIERSGQPGCHSRRCCHSCREEES